MGKWTRAGIIRDILQREADGRPLTASLSEGGVEHSMYQAASRIFGSWRNAVVAAGLPASRSRSNSEWTPARIRRLIRSLASRKAPLRAKELQEKYGSFLQAARRHFGSWSKAVAASGVDPQRMKRTPSWSKERVIEHILILSLRNESLDRRFVQPRALADAASRLFGSWKSAVVAAGLECIAGSGASPAQHPEGDQPLSIGFRADSDTPAIVDHVPGKHWTQAQVLEGIRRRSRAGQSVRATEVSEDNHGLFAAGVRRFGNWRNTLAAAGIEPHTTHRTDAEV